MTPGFLTSMVSHLSLFCVKLLRNNIAHFFRPSIARLNVRLRQLRAGGKEINKVVLRID